MIDSAFHPEIVVISFNEKNLTPSPAEEQIYLLHFVTSSLLIYY